ncbi:hypothetical protein D3C80_2232150 [compost metagenome]
MVDARLVEVDGLLDPSQAEGVREKPVVLPGVRCHGRHVMKSFDTLDHDLAFCIPVGLGC